MIGAPVGVLRHDVAHPPGPVDQHDRRGGVGDARGHAAVARVAENVAQPGGPRGRHGVAHAAPAGPAPLLDRVRAERCVRPAGPAVRAGAVRQPAADAAARQLEQQPPVRARPQLLPAVAPVRPRVPQPAQPDRDQADRQPVGHAQERHVRQVPQTAAGVHGRQPVAVRLLQRPLCVHGVPGQQDQQERDDDRKVRYGFILYKIIILIHDIRGAGAGPGPGGVILNRVTVTPQYAVIII